MERKKISVHAITIHIYQIAVVVLLLIIAVLGFKYVHLKLAVKGYTQSTIWMNSQEKPNGQVSDYAVIVSQSVLEIPPSSLQGYIASLSKQLNRDIVVVDKSEKILADTVSANVGTVYSFDRGKEVKMTIEDGQIRKFEEKSADYPNGLIEVVVPIKNAKGDITGAVLISNTQVFR